jgi:hypothetical protein
LIFISITINIWIFIQLDNVNTRLNSLERGFSLLYEQTTMPVIIRLLNDLHLIDIRELHNRTLSSSQSDSMKLFFCFVSSRMQNDYSER